MTLQPSIGAPAYQLFMLPHIAERMGHYNSSLEQNGRQPWMVSSVLEGLEMMTTYVGFRLGFYEALRTEEWTTAKDLANRTGTNCRYVREWLEQKLWQAFWK